MNEILFGSLIISVLHALLPNHWLPVLAIGKQHQWSLRQITYIVLLAGLAHAGSTVLIGWGLAFLSWSLHDQLREVLHIAGPLLLILLGAWFMYRHHTHHHFHLDDHEAAVKRTPRGVLWALMLSMFLSPCMEIEAYFVLAGAKGMYTVLVLSFVYMSVTVAGMCLWVRLMYKGMAKYDWHGLEHKAGLITGGTLILTGVAAFFLH